MQDVLVTGGTGAFGRAFALHLLRHSSAERIVIFSRNEHNQCLMADQLSQYAPRLRFILGDVRDKDGLTMAMRGVSHVVHAAALKRIENGLYNPLAVAETNVGGTANVVWAAMSNKIRKVILLSSDKAFAPVSPYGASKLMAEYIFVNANNMRGWGGPLFSVTRYGNVWNSTGSVVPTWRAIMRDGTKQVPVTDPNCTRFFMYLSEAVNMVLNTFSTMKGGEVVIPPLPAYRLGDLAEAMGAEMQITGLKPHEKMHESMREGLSSDTARRMSVDELRVILHDT